MLLRPLLDQQVLFFAGKGGVGKTTCSAAFSMAASRMGRKTLLVSTDPAHSTSDIFEQPIGPQGREVLPGLSAIEVDAEAEAARYVADVKRDIERMFSPGVIRQAHRQIELAAASPGLLEVALLDRLIDLIVDHQSQQDLIVLDTAPTGHTLQLLRMPDAVSTWVQALVRHRRAILEIDRGAEQTPEQAFAADPILAALERRHARLVRLRTILADRRRTSFVFVTIPERLAIEETARAVRLVGEIGVDVGAVVVNRVLPDDAEGAFYESRRQTERPHLDDIDRRFSGLTRVRVRQLASDVHGLESLSRVSAELL